MHQWNEPLFDSDGMRSLDRHVIEEHHVPGIVLMETAAMAVVQCAAELVNGDWTGRRVAVLAGGGNNGGDGLAVARLLYRRGAAVAVLLAGDPSRITGDAFTNLEAVRSLEIPVISVDDSEQMKDVLDNAQLYIDALLGVGARGAPRGAILELIDEAARRPIPVVAIDVPSGVDPDTGETPGRALRATLTVACGCAKPGLAITPGSLMAGKVVIADIGIGIHSHTETPFHWITPHYVRSVLPQWYMDDHKGRHGHLLVIGGSAGMSGAPALALRAALRSGAGLCSAVVPGVIRDSVAIQVPEAMVTGLASAEPWLDGSVVHGDALSRCSAVAMGPGLGTSPACKGALAAVFKNRVPAMVLDADALNLMSADRSLKPVNPEQCVLTPHPGEAARMLDITASEVQAHRLTTARVLAVRTGCVVVLKGAGTLVAAPDGRVLISSSGNPGMATGGAGDVLTGCIGALLAAGMAPFDAAACGAFLHGLAGDIASIDHGLDGLTAGGIVDALPKAFLAVRQGTAPVKWSSWPMDHV